MDEKICYTISRRKLAQSLGRLFYIAVERLLKMEYLPPSWQGQLACGAVLPDSAVFFARNVASLCQRTHQILCL